MRHYSKGRSLVKRHALLLSHINIAMSKLTVAVPMKVCFGLLLVWASITCISVDAWGSFGVEKLRSGRKNIENCRTRFLNLESNTALPSIPLQYETEKRQQLHVNVTINNTTRVVKTVRSVDWCGSKGMLPWQKYHMNALTSKKEQPEPSSEAGITLSRSSQHLYQNFDSLTSDERRRLQQKVRAEARASQQLDPSRHFHPIYIDNNLVVANKPSGILCVPGPRRNPSLANLAHQLLCDDDYNVDKMVVHRLDMDTSGVVVFALSEAALSALHCDFRERRVKKTYQALLCGHVPVNEGDINLPLERDPTRPPFMRVATSAPPSESDVLNSVIIHEGFQKFIKQAPKPSLTSFRLLTWEHLNGYPVTRIELTPFTGRTHQLRVHCAAIGHPIVADDIYGYLGEGAPNGGWEQQVMDDLYPHHATIDLQKNIHSIVETTQLGLCLHAQQLCIDHPLTRAPMIFEADAPF